MKTVASKVIVYIIPEGCFISENETAVNIFVRDETFFNILKLEYFSLKLLENSIGFNLLKLKLNMFTNFPQTKQIPVAGDTLKMCFSSWR